MENQGATVVITHHVLQGKQQEYENWLTEIGPLCRSWPGNIDWQIIRPIPDLTFVYTIIIRFDSIENLKNWIDSKERTYLIRKINHILAKDDKYHVKSGLEFLFVNEEQNLKIPVRWKQYLVTWSAIYPLSVCIPILLFPLFRYLNLSENCYLDSFFISGTIVFIMVYLLMPSYTKLIKSWLYK